MRWFEAPAVFEIPSSSMWVGCAAAKGSLWAAAGGAARGADKGAVGNSFWLMTLPLPAPRMARYILTISDPVPFFLATTNLQTSREFSVLRVDTNPLAFTPSTPINLHLIHIAHHGQLSRAAQGHWHGRSIYPAKPLVGEKVPGRMATIGVATSRFLPGIASVCRRLLEYFC
jgi:hypothetical protein